MTDQMYELKAEREIVSDLVSDRLREIAEEGTVLGPFASERISATE